MTLPGWIPVAGGLVQLVVLALVGLAIVGKFRWKALEEYEKLSEARGERITVMESEHQRYREEMAAKHTNYERQVETLGVSIEALQATVALLERRESDAARRNIELQRQLEASHRRIADLEAEALARRTSTAERQAASEERMKASEERCGASSEREAASHERAERHSEGKPREGKQ